MKRLLLLSLITLFFTPSNIYGQDPMGSRRPGDADKMARDRDRQRMEEREAQFERRRQELDALASTSKSSRDLRKEDEEEAKYQETKYRREIADMMRQLSDTSTALSTMVQNPNKEKMKEVSKLASKIAKLSKNLRQKFNEGDRVAKIATPSDIDMSNRETQISQLVQNISNITKQVVQTDLVNIVDLDIRQGMTKQLELMESQAMSLTILAKS